MLSEGSVLAGRYRLIHRLGRGGMGDVWRAEHLGLSSHVAIKLIDEEVIQSEETLARFKREAQAAASLRMSHVVQILDYGVDGQNPYIAMELLEGESLSTRLERQGALPPEETASIISQVGRALCRAHELGVVHRDLKPDNIFLVADGDQEIAKVLDFGIAKMTSKDPERVLLNTTTGALLGTPYYMSPEQATAQEDVDHLTDVWALGVLTFECLTGRRPFDGASIGAIVVAICSQPLPVPSDFGAVPAGFDSWFQTACSRERSSRFGSAAAATAALRRLCGLELGRASMPSLPPLNVREKDDSSSAPAARTVLGHAGAAPATILRGTPEPSLLTVSQATSSFAQRKRVLAAAGGGVAALLLLLIVANWAAPEEGAPQAVVASDSGGKSSPPDDGASPVAEMEANAIDLEDLALEPDRKSSVSETSTDKPRRAAQSAVRKPSPGWLLQKPEPEPGSSPPLVPPSKPEPEKPLEEDLPDPPPFVRSEKNADVEERLAF